MFEKVRTPPFDWPALSALNTSNADASAGAGGSLKPQNKRDNPSAGASGDAKRKRCDGDL